MVGHSEIEARAEEESKLLDQCQNASHRWVLTESRTRARVITEF